ncbi:MAG TPA: DUF305 domain-containing protein [Mycobacterium sp.]|nr:DUF305 domain-containing protein [Mycobacterium sp.]
MRSSPARVAAAFTAVVLAVVPAACTGPADSAGDGRSDSVFSETPVITGKPAGFNPADITFADNMIAHHKQAIELAALVPDRSTDPELVTLASQIPAVQQPEINILNVFLVQWNENPEAGSGGADGQAGHGQSMDGMVDDATVAKLESLRGTEFDTLWLQSMIAHHQGAVEMAKTEIADGENIDAIAMAKTMAAAQEAEIGQMKKLLERSDP